MIQHRAKLAELVESLKAAGPIAVDTEADSLHAYPEKLCLIQVSLTDRHELVDPLAGLPLLDLFDELARHPLVFHGADYDLRLLWRTRDFRPGKVFDTMLAARLLGFQAFGLSDLVRNLLGVQLEKGSQKANWARRPLTLKMEEYARNDTRYLLGLHEALTGELIKRGRIEWHQQMCDRLVEECVRPVFTDPDLVWRIKGSDRLAPPALAVLRELWLWREREAVRTDMPPYFVLPHEMLIQFAALSCANRPLRLPPRLSEARRRSLNEALARGLAVAPADYPLVLRPKAHRPTEQEQKRARELQARRDQTALRLELDPSIIAPRAMLLRLAKDWDRHSQELMPWQRDLLLTDSYG